MINFDTSAKYAETPTVLRTGSLRFEEAVFWLFWRGSDVCFPCRAAPPIPYHLKWEGLGSFAWIRFDMAYIGLWSCMIKHSSQRTSRFILIFFLHRNAFSSMSTMIPPHNVLLHVLVCTTSSCLLFRISSSNGTWGKKENTFFSKCLNILSTRPRGKNKPRSIYQWVGSGIETDRLKMSTERCVCLWSLDYFWTLT